MINNHLTDNWQKALNLTDKWQMAKILTDNWHLFFPIQTLLFVRDTPRYAVHTILKLSTFHPFKWVKFWQHSK